MIFYTQKIYTKNGFVKENILGNKKALDVGCGKRKLSGAVGVDINKDGDADLVHNLNEFTWPLESNSFNLVLVQHVLEHLEDVGRVMDEIYRVCKNDARIVIQVPYFRSKDAYTDPTHKHFFTMNSVDFFADKTKFKKIGFWFGWPQKSKNPAVNLFKWFIFRYPNFYERYLSLIFPFECLTWELEAVK